MTEDSERAARQEEPRPRLEASPISSTDEVFRDIHHDQLNELGEETWSGLGEQSASQGHRVNPGREFSLNVATVLQTPPYVQANVQQGAAGVLNVTRESSSPELETSASANAQSELSRENSQQTLTGSQGTTNDAFLTEEVDELLSKSTNGSRSDTMLTKDSGGREDSGGSGSEAEPQEKAESELQVHLDRHPKKEDFSVNLMTCTTHPPSSLQQFELAVKANLKSRSQLFEGSDESVKSKPFKVDTGSSIRKVSAEFCRICHEMGLTEAFISPCGCRGSLSVVHKSCLERWLAESDSSHCELCGHRYATRRIPKYGLFSSMYFFLTLHDTWRERRDLVIDLLALLIISPVVGLSTLMALQLADSLFAAELSAQRKDIRFPNVHENTRVEWMIPLGDPPPKLSLEVLTAMATRLGQMGVISMVITLDTAYVSWVAMRLQYHFTKWYSWYRRNCKVTLTAFPDQVTVTPQPAVSSILFPSDVRSISY